MQVAPKNILLVQYSENNSGNVRRYLMFKNAVDSRFPGEFEHRLLSTSHEDICFEIDLLTSSGARNLHSQKNGDGYLDERKLRKILIKLDVLIDPRYYPGS